MADITIATIREKFPAYDDMSDEALATALHKKYYSDMPLADFGAKIGMQLGDPLPAEPAAAPTDIPAAPPPIAMSGREGRYTPSKPAAPSQFDGESPVDLLKRRGQEVVGGAADTTASSIEGMGAMQARSLALPRSAEAAGTMASERDQTISDIKDKLADPDISETTRQTLLQTMEDMQKGQPRLQSVADGKGMPADMMKEFTDPAKALRQGAEDLVGKAPKDESIWSQLAQGAGSMLGFMGTTAVGGIAGGPAGSVAATALAGGTSNAGQLYNEAKAAGASEEDAQRAAGWGFLTGLTEAVPIGHAIHALPSKFRDSVISKVSGRIGAAFASAGEESAQELVAQILNNMTAKGIYDSARGVMDGAGTAALIGAILGAPLGAAFHNGTRTSVVPPPSDIAPDASAALAPKPTEPDAAPEAMTEAPTQVPADIAVALGTPTESEARSRARVILDGIAERRSATSQGNPPPMPQPAAPEPAPAPPAPPAQPTAVVSPSGLAVPIEQAPAASPTAAPVEQPAPGHLPRTKSAAEILSERDRAAKVPENLTTFVDGAIPTVPEAPATIEQQRADLQAGKRGVVMYPASGVTPPELGQKGIKRIYISGVGTFDYAASGKNAVSAQVIRYAVRNNKLNEILGLGPFNKEEVAQSVAAGNDPVAVVERTPEGVEVKAAAGTTETAPEQVAALEATKSEPENIVALEAPADVIAQRQAAQEAAPVAEAPVAEASVAEQPAEVTAPPVQQKAPVVEARKPTSKLKPKLAAIKEKVQQKAPVQTAEDMLAEKPVPEAPPVVEKTPEGKRRIILQPTAEQRAEIDKASARMDEEIGANIKSLDGPSKSARVAAAEEKAAERIDSRRDVTDRILRGEIKQGAEEAAARSHAETSKSAPRDRARAENADKAQKVMDKFGAKRIGDMRNPKEREALLERANAALAYAKELGVTHAATVTDVTPDALVWLSDLRMLARKLATKRAPSAAVIDEAQSMHIDEAMTVSGDSRPARRRRIEVGTARAGGKIGGSDALEKVAAPTVDMADVAAEEDTAAADVVDAENLTDLMGADDAPIGARVSASARAAPRLNVTEGAASEVKTVEASADEKAELLKKYFPVLRSRYAAEEAKLSPDEMVPQEVTDFVPYALTTTTVGKLRNVMEDWAIIARQTSETSMNRFTEDERDMMGSITPRLFALMSDITPETKIHVMPDDVFDMMPYADGASAFYVPWTDEIYIREDTYYNPADRVHVLAHEVAHAAFMHNLRIDRGVRERLDILREMAAEYVEGTPEASAYGLTNTDEFVSEMWSNPRFQQMLAQMPLSKDMMAALQVPKSFQSRITNVLSAVKFFVARVLGFPAKGGNILSVGLDTTGYLLDSATKARSAYYGALGYPEALAPAQARVTPKGNAGPRTIEGKLRARGLSQADAIDIGSMLREEYAELSDEQLDAFVAAYNNPEASETQTAQNDAILPPEAADPGVPGKKNAEPKHATAARRFRLRLQTLDYITRRYRALFNDAEGNALDDYANASYAFDPVKREVEKVHDHDFASFEDLRRKNPKEAQKVSELIYDLQAMDVNLAPNASNEHLGKTAKRGLQAKKALPRLRTMYNALSPEARAIMDTMARNNRETHNTALEAAVYKIIQAAGNPDLTNSQTQAIMKAAVNGELDEDHKAMLGNEEVWKILTQSRDMRAKRGLYFPASRFGDWVVTSERKIPAPGLTSFTMRGGKQIPITSEVTGNTVTFTPGSTERGAGAPFERAIDQWVASHELTMLSYKKRFRDNITGEIVTEGMQDATREYTPVIQIQLQNAGVHFFDSQKEAQAFHGAAEADLTGGKLTSLSQVEERHEHGQLGKVMNITAHGAIMSALNKRDNLSAPQKALLGRVLEEALILSAPGNRYESRMLKRKNVLGASEDAARAAAHYGRAAGNYMAVLMTMDERRKAFERMVALRRGGENSQVLNEIERREQSFGIDKVGQTVSDIMTINSMDKLASPANWALNATQVMMNTAPLLAGRHGDIRATAALLSAYKRIGTLGTIGRGLAATARNIAHVRRTGVDTANFIGSIRSNLGIEYHDLIDELVRMGDISQDIGVENSAALSSGRGKWGTGLAKVDRIARQMPNAIEAINRATTAVAAFDLATRGGQSREEAIKHAIDMVRQSQGRYDNANAPMFMRGGGLLRFMMVFKKYAQLQYQLLGDMTYRMFKDADKAERKIAGRQLRRLIVTNALVVGAMGLPGMEVIKWGATLVLAALGESWEDKEDEIRKAVTSAAGKEWGDIINEGLLSYATGVDLQARMGWQDLAAGFPPAGLTSDDLKMLVGTTIAGAPGGMLFDYAQAVAAFKKGEVAKAMSLVVPVKVISDSIKAANGLQRGTMSPADAAKKAIGFNSLRQSQLGDELGTKIRASKEKSDKPKALAGAYMSAMTPEEVRRAKAAIDAYNAGLAKGERKIGLKGLEVRRLQNVARFK